MRFKSRANASDYIRAGAEGARQGAEAFVAARRNSPDYGKLAEASIQTRGAERIAAMEAQSRVAQAGINAHKHVKNTKTKVEAEAKVADIKRGAKRFAGMVGGLGSVAVAGMALAAPKDKEDSSWKDKYHAAEDKIMQQMMAMYDRQGSDDGPELQEIPDAPEFNSDGTKGGTKGGTTGGTKGESTGGGTKPEGAISSGDMGAKGSWTTNSMQKLLEKHGMSSDNARILAAIGKGESGGNASIDTVQSRLDPNQTNEFSVGLFQINNHAHSDKLSRRGWSVDDLRDPDKNAQIAIEVFQEAGNSFNPWSVYTSGKYKKYL